MIPQYITKTCAINRSRAANLLQKKSRRKILICQKVRAFQSHTGLCHRAYANQLISVRFKKIVANIPNLWSVFRTHHGSGIVYNVMSHNVMLRRRQVFMTSYSLVKQEGNSKFANFDPSDFSLRVEIFDILDRNRFKMTVFTFRMCFVGKPRPVVFEIPVSIF